MMVPPDGLKVRISISDPWDFYTENGSVATGRIVGVSEGTSCLRPEFKIELDAPLKQKELAAKEVFARLRHRNDTIDLLSSGERVSCNFSNCPDEEWGRRQPEARMGFIGSLQLEFL
ncbi:hypothetical protein [Bradyrhizobium canariense]|uniref:Uncharacterized protein n=1 Tax=Bradyrhizobium canariense TaxID=255045 RepID=A0A1H1VX75_9BRAD|nr:hypothetical protein [Bradyrhizobium canariense]SDS88846.1 hypothetical protein SAMN05444158_3574 [Bradyrhizobium canariense]